MKRIITFGEIMLRLTPPNYEKIRTANTFEASYGGSEANIALALANLGVMLPGMISGVISDAIGYEKFFLWALVSAIPAFVLTWVLPFTYPDPQEQK